MTPPAVPTAQNSPSGEMQTLVATLPGSREAAALWSSSRGQCGWRSTWRDALLRPKLHVCTDAERSCAVTTFAHAPSRSRASQEAIAVTGGSRSVSTRTFMRRAFFSSGPCESSALCASRVAWKLRSDRSAPALSSCSAAPSKPSAVDSSCPP